MFERDLPGQNSMGFNTTTISDLPLEMCETMNGSWGYNLQDSKYKSTKKLIHTMVRAAGFGANFLLNTGPMPNGKIQQENIQTLKEMGKWMESFGESIYGTRRGPIPPRTWGATTSKGNMVYLHILDLEGNALVVPSLEKEIDSIVYFSDGSSVDYETTDLGIIIHVPENKLHPIDTILKVQYRERK